MTSLASTPPCRTALPPVTGSCRWAAMSPSAFMLDSGCAWLRITTTWAGGKESVGDYWVKRLWDGPRVVGYRLTKFDAESGAEGESYDVDSTFDPADCRTWTCECPSYWTHSQRRPDRCCRHTRGLYAGLKAAGLL